MRRNVHKCQVKELTPISEVLPQPKTIKYVKKLRGKRLFGSSERSFK